MNDLALQPVPTWVLGLLAAGGWLTAAVWLFIVTRLFARQPLVAYEPRVPVPWRGLDLALILACYLVLQVAGAWAVMNVVPEEKLEPPAIYNPENTQAQHMVARVLAEGDWRLLLLCGFAAALVAPVVEEFLFRVLLQGWLEAEQSRWRAQLPTLRRLLPGAVGPIALTSFIFAMMHFRVAGPTREPEYYVAFLLANAVASLATMALAIALLHSRCEATAADLGWDSRRFWHDVRLGLVTFFAIATPIYLLQMILSSCLPKYLAPDPFALFALSAVLGFLYAQTHRIVPSIVVHMSLNTFSLAMAWAMLAK